MVVTRSRASKLRASSDNDKFSTPRKTLHTPSKSIAPPIPLRSLPTHCIDEHRYVCCTCKRIEDCEDFPLKREVSDLSLDSNYISTYKTVERRGHMISEFEIKIKYISKQIDNIEKLILDHSALINNLERDICRFAGIPFNYRSNPNPESITFPVSGSHTGECSRSRSAEAQPTGVSMSNRRQPCVTPSIKIRPSLSASETRNAVDPISNTVGYQPAGVPPVAGAQITPNSILVLGDSNTKHIRLGGPHITMKREPTFTVEAIYPHKVVGYHKVWILVGINSLKRHHCRNMTEVKHKLDIFMKKVNEIKSVSPNTKVIVSPILPTAIPDLNSCALYFNSLLFAQKREWGLLGFDAFCDSSGLLAPVYRRYSDKSDRIHLGFRGINLLTSKLRAEISLTDGGASRLWSRVVLPLAISNYDNKSRYNNK